MIHCIFPNGNKASLRHGTVQAIVEKDNALLLVKRSPELIGGNLWSLPAGYISRNETAVESVLRELHEETGWEGEVISLFRINTDPNRRGEDTQNIVIEFLIKPIKQTNKPDSESSKVEWIPIEKLLPFTEFAFDHGKSIELYLQYRQKQFSLPLFV